MKKFNGIVQVEIDDVGEYPRPKGELMRAACDRFLISRGLKTYEFNRQYGRKSKQNEREKVSPKKQARH